MEQTRYLMRNVITAALILILAFGVYTAKAEEQKGKKETPTETVTYDVNINCDNCKARLEKHIPFEKGVKDMEVDIPGKQVTVKFDKKKNTTEGIALAIEKLGYTCSVADPDPEE